MWPLYFSFNSNENIAYFHLNQTSRPDICSFMCSRHELLNSNPADSIYLFSFNYNLPDVTVVVFIQFHENIASFYLIQTSRPDICSFICFRHELLHSNPPDSIYSYSINSNLIDATGSIYWPNRLRFATRFCCTECHVTYISVREPTHSCFTWYWNLLFNINHHFYILSFYQTFLMAPPGAKIVQIKLKWPKSSNPLKFFLNIAR